MKSPRTVRPASRSTAYYVVIRGPLGVGKTSVARRVAKKIGALYISIDQILEDRDLWYAGRLSEFLRANEFAAQRALRALSNGTPVVLDGNFYWKTQIADVSRRLPYPHRVFTLKAPLAACVARDGGRHPPHGRLAGEQVYAKSTRFNSGVAIDAVRPTAEVVSDIVGRLPAARNA
jgi:hypothetical protein